MLLICGFYLIFNDINFDKKNSFAAIVLKNIKFKCLIYLINIKKFKFLNHVICITFA